MRAAGDYPMPEPSDAVWEWYCARCNIRCDSGRSFCTPCVNDMWEHAESMSSSPSNLHEIIQNLRRYWLDTKSSHKTP